MAFPASDGSRFTNHPAMKQHEAKLSARQPAAMPQADGDQGGSSIMSDPEAMQCIQLLQSKGYTAEDVEAAMGGAPTSDTVPGEEAYGDAGANG